LNDRNGKEGKQAFEIENPIEHDATVWSGKVGQMGKGLKGEKQPLERKV
jgi:hypothetical protein